MVAATAESKVGWKGLMKDAWRVVMKASLLVGVRVDATVVWKAAMSVNYWAVMTAMSLAEVKGMT